MMSLVAPGRARTRPAAAARRFGYVLAIGLNVLFWYLVNVRPGWDVLPFLTADTTQLVAWWNISIAISILINIAWLVYDPRWFKALGDLVNAVVALAVLGRVWRVFPFDFSMYDIEWLDLMARAALALAIIGTLIGVVASVVSLARLTVGKGEDHV